MMWPFTRSKERTMHTRRIDENFAVTGQITPAGLKAVHIPTSGSLALHQLPSTARR